MASIDQLEGLEQLPLIDVTRARNTSQMGEPFQPFRMRVGGAVTGAAAVDRDLVTSRRRVAVTPTKKPRHAGLSRRSWCRWKLLDRFPGGAGGTRIGPALQRGSRGLGGHPARSTLFLRALPCLACLPRPNPSSTPTVPDQSFQTHPLRAMQPVKRSSCSWALCAARCPFMRLHCW